MIEKMPVQIPRTYNTKGSIAKDIYMRAYEVYSEVYGEQDAMITGGCRGGFSTGELIVFLYAYSFPKEEWSKRVHFAFANMELS